MENFKRRTTRVAELAFPVIKNVYENAGKQYVNMMVPITDGRMVYQITVPLEEAYKSKGKSVLTSFEKVILLRTIDDGWKENLRELDELKHSVQNASYEQKDPLLIFKLESVKLFDNMVSNINNQAISTLMRVQIPGLENQQPAEVESSKEVDEKGQQDYVESKVNLDEDGNPAGNEVNRKRRK